LHPHYNCWVQDHRQESKIKDCKNNFNMDFIVDYSIGKGFIINIAAEAAAMNKRDYIMGL
jgi:hypothetical protein